MRMRSIFLSSLLPALLLTAGSVASTEADASLILPLSQERTVWAAASAVDSTSSDTAGDSDAVNDFGRFRRGVGASALIDSGFTSVSAYQDSVIAGEGIVAYGNCGGGFFLGGSGSSGEISARSELSVTFELPGSSDYTLVGTLNPADVGNASLTLEGPGGPVHELSPLFGTLVVDESGTLVAGEYTLHLIASVESGAAGPIQFEMYAAYDIALDFGSGGLTDPGGEVPDGDDLPTGDPLHVAKLPGDLVRLTWGLSCRHGDNDYAVYEGPLGDWPGLLPVTCSTARQLDHEFAPTFDPAIFVVVPNDGVVEGSYGDTSGDVERASPPAACWPQVLGDPICP